MTNDHMKRFSTRISYVETVAMFAAEVIKIAAAKAKGKA